MIKVTFHCSEYMKGSCPVLKVVTTQLNTKQVNVTFTGVHNHPPPESPKPSSEVNAYAKVRLQNGATVSTVHKEMANKYPLGIVYNLYIYLCIFVNNIVIKERQFPLVRSSTTERATSTPLVCHRRTSFRTFIWSSATF